MAANASGAEIYQQKCQFCHGGNGQGARGPSLKDAVGDADAALYKVVHDGRQNGRKKMPAFGTQLSETQITRVVAHVKQLKPGT